MTSRTALLPKRKGCRDAPNEMEPTEQELNEMSDRYYKEICKIPVRDEFNHNLHFMAFSRALMTVVVRLHGVAISGETISNEITKLAGDLAYNEIERIIRLEVSERN